MKMTLRRHVHDLHFGGFQGSVAVEVNPVDATLHNSFEQSCRVERQINEISVFMIPQMNVLNTRLDNKLVPKQVLSESMEVCWRNFPFSFPRRM